MLTFIKFQDKYKKYIKKIKIKFIYFSNIYKNLVIALLTKKSTFFLYIHEVHMTYCVDFLIFKFFLLCI